MADKNSKQAISNGKKFFEFIALKHLKTFRSKQ